MYTLINIIGLSIGIACFIGIIAFTSSELSYDKHHKDFQDIYRIKLKGNMSGTEFEAAVCGGPVSEILFNELPEVKMFTRIIQHPRTVLFSRDENEIYQEGILFADTSFLRMFEYTLSGDRKNPLNEPNSLVMLRSTAEKYFGKNDPIGETIKWNNKDEYTVKAIIEEPLKNSHIDFEVLVSRASLCADPRYETLFNSLFGFTNISYIKSDSPEKNELEEKVNQIFRNNIDEMLEETGSELNIGLQRLIDIHLRSNITHEIAQNGNIISLYIMIIVAVLIIIISSFNYINLSIANSETRRFEAGIKKIYGAKPGTLFLSYLVEAFILVSISFFFGLLILNDLSQLFNSITDISFDELLRQYTSWPVLIGIMLFITFTTGSYPALKLTYLNPVTLLSQKNTSRPKRNHLQKAMIFFQLLISVFLLSNIWFIHKQINYINNKNPGFEKDNLVVLALRNESMMADYPTLRNELIPCSGVLEVSASSAWPGNFNQRRAFYIDGKSRKDMMMILNLQCEDNYLQQMDIKLNSGRYFLPDSEADKNKIIVNETLVKELELKNPIGKALRLPIGETEADDQKMEIIGICNDFHYASLHSKIKPLIIWKDESLRRFVSVKIQENKEEQALAWISEKWSEVYPGFPFDYFFLKDRYNALYKQETNQNKVFLIFTLVAVLITCLGVYGLTSFTTRQRTKEIGIRKVLGANRIDLMKIISLKYLYPLILAATVAVPASMIFLNKWLQNFSYKTDIQPYIFLLSPLIIGFISLLTSNIVTLKESGRNPVEAIRYE